MNKLNLNEDKINDYIEYAVSYEKDVVIDFIKDKNYKPCTVVAAKDRIEEVRDWIKNEYNIFGNNLKAIAVRPELQLQGISESVLEDRARTRLEEELDAGTFTDHLGIELPKDTSKSSRKNRSRRRP
tara:strand:- start:11143 stop:11523 length:381 start_codon:yes stop_codon:yes gene_type:complete